MQLMNSVRANDIHAWRRRSLAALDGERLQRRFAGLAGLLDKTAEIQPLP